MQEIDWKKVKYFSKEENWGDWTKMNTELILGLDCLRDFIGKPINIHCGYEERTGLSYHNYGKAIDCSCKDMNVVDFFLAASRFTVFTGIGIYPYWNKPGFHLDVRPLNKFRSLWASTTKGKYQPITSELLKTILNWNY